MVPSAPVAQPGEPRRCCHLIFSGFGAEQLLVGGGLALKLATGPQGARRSGVTAKAHVVALAFQHYTADSPSRDIESQLKSLHGQQAKPVLVAFRLIEPYLAFTGLYTFIPCQMSP